LSESTHHHKPIAVDDCPQTAADSALLAESAFALLRCETAGDVYEVIASFLVGRIPDAVVIVNEATEDLEYLIPRVVKGVDQGVLARAAESPGLEIIGTSFTCSPEYRAELLGGRLIRLDGGLFDLCSDGMPRQLAELAVSEFGVTDAYTIGISNRERALGNCHILTRSPDAHVPAQLIESLARHCFSALIGIERARAAASAAEDDQLLLASMVEGLALHEMIFDEHGVPVDYRFLSVNPSFEAMTGLSASDIVGRTVLEVLPHTEPSWIERYGAVVATGVPATFEDFAAELNRYYRVVAYSPQPGRFATLIEDITERKASERSLEMSQERLQLALAATCQGLYDLDMRTGLATVTPEYRRVTGDSEVDLTVSLSEFKRQIHPDDAPRVMAVIEAFTRGDIDEYREEYRIRHRSGSWVWVRSLGAVVEREPDGRAARVLGTHTDITQQRETESALRETADLLQAALDQSPAGIAIANAPDGALRYVNQAGLNIRGGDLGSIADAGFEGYVAAWRLHDLDGAPLDWDQVPLTRALLYGETNSREFIVRRAEDDDRVVIANAAPIIGGQGVVIGAIVVFTDITERKLMEQALRRSELLLAASVESQKSTILFSIDAKYRYLYFNAAHVDVMRYAYGQEIEVGVNILDCITSDEDRVAAKENYDRALAGESHSNIRVYGDRELAYYESFFNPIIDADGAVIGATGLARDITERMRAEARLAETSSYLDTLFQYSNAPIIVWDSELTITRFNPAFEELSGLRADDVVGKRLQLLFPPDQAKNSPDYLTDALEGKRWEAVEIPVTAVDGSVHTVLWSSTIIHDESGEHTIATIAQGHDITERKIAEDALITAVGSLQRSNQDLEQFAYIASHDLQEPLRMVSMYTELLRRRYHGQLDADADEFIDYAVEGAKRMSQLLADLLDYSRVGTRGKQPLPVCAQTAMEEALANLQGQIDDTGACISVGALPNVIADESQLMRVFQNLISNSLKFHREGVPPTVAITAEPEGTLWRFCIVDNGIGIESEYFSQAFETFRRLHPRASFPGTGIGLAICKRIVERLGGTIWVESSSETGTTFCFTLPAAS